MTKPRIYFSEMKDLDAMAKSFDHPAAVCDSAKTAQELSRLCNLGLAWERAKRRNLGALIRMDERTDAQLAHEAKVSWSSVMRAKRGDKMSERVVAALMGVLDE